MYCELKLEMIEFEFYFLRSYFTVWQKKRGVTVFNPSVSAGSNIKAITNQYKFTH